MDFLVDASVTRGPAAGYTEITLAEDGSLAVAVRGRAPLGFVRRGAATSGAHR
jgi:hypothetical protein